MEKIRFGIIGAGWRSTFFIRIANLMPESFGVTGVLMRDGGKAKEFSAKHNVRTFLNFDQFIASSPDFVIVSVPRSASMDYLKLLMKMGIPILCETPPAWDRDSLIELWELAQKQQAKIQIAEQYFARPMIAARLKAVEEGLLGETSYVNLSLCHGYHGINLIRRFLGLGFENVLITGKTYELPTTQNAARSGELSPSEFVEKKVSRDIVTFAFANGKLALYDFSGEQYRSHIRKSRIQIQGLRGEIIDHTARYLTQEGIPVTANFLRIDKGVEEDLDGFCHRSIVLGEREVYKNPYLPARLSDDEIAIAYCLEQMHGYLQGTAPAFYPLEEALQDTYLALCMEEALRSGKAVESTTQPWAL